MSILTDHFLYRDRIRLTWSFLWPSYTAGVVLDLLKPLIADDKSTGNAVAYYVVEFPILLFFFTWAIRRAVRLEYPRFHMVVIHGRERVKTRLMSYREGLSVAWLLNWRAGALSLFVIAPIVGIFFMAFGGGFLKYWPLGIVGKVWSAGFALLAQIVVYSLIVESAFLKKYSGFSLDLEKGVDHAVQSV